MAANSLKATLPSLQCTKVPREPILISENEGASTRLFLPDFGPGASTLRSISRPTPCELPTALHRCTISSKWWKQAQQIAELTTTYDTGSNWLNTLCSYSFAQVKSSMNAFEFLYCEQNYYYHIKILWYSYKILRFNLFGCPEQQGHFLHHDRLSVSVLWHGSRWLQ